MSTLSTRCTNTKTHLQVLVLEDKFEVVQGLPTKCACRCGREGRVARVEKHVAIASPGDPEGERSRLIVEFEVRRFLERGLVRGTWEVLRWKGELLRIRVRNGDV